MLSVAVTDTSVTFHILTRMRDVGHDISNVHRRAHCNLQQDMSALAAGLLEIVICNILYSSYQNHMFLPFSCVSGSVSTRKSIKFTSVYNNFF